MSNDGKQKNSLMVTASQCFILHNTALSFFFIVTILRVEKVEELSYQ